MATDIPDKQYFKIGEVAEIAGVLPHDHECIVDNLIDALRTSRDPGQELGESGVVVQIEFFERAAIAAYNGF